MLHIVCVCSSMYVVLIACVIFLCVCLRIGLLCLNRVLVRVLVCVLRIMILLCRMCRFRVLAFVVF